MKGLDFVGIDPDIARDRKIAEMAQALGRDRYWVAGHFPQFFGAIARHAADGNLSNVSDDLLDDWAGGVEGWGALVRRLMCDEHGTLRAWYEYNGRALERLKRDRERKAEERRADLPGADAEPKAEKSKDIPRNVRARSTAYTDTETDTDTKQQEQHTPPTAAAVEVGDLKRDFEVAWQAYPRRPDNPRGKALKAYLARRKAGVSAEELLAGVHAYAGYIARERIEPRFIKHAATFFGPHEVWRPEQYAPVKGSTLSPGQRVLQMLEEEAA